MKNPNTTIPKSTENKAELIDRYKKIRSFTEKICNKLHEEDTSSQPVLFVSPPKWHLAHTTWFFEQFILVNLLKENFFNERYAFLFNSYYDTIGERVQRDQRGGLTRPVFKEIKAYRRIIDERICEAIEKNELHAMHALLELGLNHEQQHQELLLTDIKYILGHNPLLPAFHTPKKEVVPRPKKDLLIIPEGVYEIGHSGKGFCFDNELGKHSVFLHTFAIHSNTVTNKEFIAFINDNAYQRPELWLSDGWAWVKENNIKCPLYWQKEGDEYLRYGLSGYKKVDDHEPVSHVSFFEADAFARWKGKRLPTEFEWETACRLFSSESYKKANYAEAGIFEPIAHDEHHHLLGNVWEWTNSAYLPYPYYKRPEGAVGEYNGKFMINQMVLRGGSCATPRGHMRVSYRNFFYPQERWQFSGIRLAEHL